MVEVLLMHQVTAAELSQPGAILTAERAQHPRASVILVNHNSRADLDRALRSLAQHTTRDCEVIVVDNGSADGSAEHVAAHHPNVTLIRSEANLGFGAGNNLAAQYATGDYLVFLNPDTTVEPGWLEELIAALEADPNAGLATSKVLLMHDPDRINACGNDVHLTGLTLCRGMGARCDALAETADVGAVSGAAFALSRDLFHALDGFDEAFFLYVEDSDLSLRARLAGFRCRYVPGSVVHHDYSLRFGPHKTYYQERNRHLMLLKAYRWRTLLVLLPALLLGELVTWGFVLLRERRHRSNKLRAYGWIGRNWPQVLDSRRATQALRRVPDRDLLALATHRLDFEQTGPGLAARAAHLIFDSLFYLLQRLALAVVWW